MAEDENNGERVLERYGQRPAAGKYDEYFPRSRNTINDDIGNAGDKKVEEQKPQSSVDEQEHEDESRSAEYGGRYRCCCCCCCCRCCDCRGYGNYNDPIVSHNGQGTPMKDANINKQQHADRGFDSEKLGRRSKRNSGL